MTTGKRNYLADAMIDNESSLHTSSTNATNSLSLQAISSALIALVEGQRETNILLERIVVALESQDIAATLADFTQHPRPDWPELDGMDE